MAGRRSCGQFLVGQVDEVHARDAEEVAFMPTRHALIQLARYWARVAFDIEYWWFLYQERV
jgi:hypothetical protein